jgi:hypothetical protein
VCGSYGIWGWVSPRADVDAVTKSENTVSIPAFYFSSISLWKFIFIQECFCVELVLICVIRKIYLWSQWFGNQCYSVFRVWWRGADFYLQYFVVIFVNEVSRTLFSHRAFGSNPVCNLAMFVACHPFHCCSVQLLLTRNCVLYTHIYTDLYLTAKYYLIYRDTLLVTFQSSNLKFEN